MNGSDVVLVSVFFAAWYGLAFRAEIHRALRVAREWVGLGLLALGHALGLAIVIADDHFMGGNNDYTG